MCIDPLLASDDLFQHIHNPAPALLTVVENWIPSSLCSRLQLHNSNKTTSASLKKCPYVMKQTAFDEEFWTTWIFGSVRKYISEHLLQVFTKTSFFPKRLHFLTEHTVTNSTENFLRDAAVDLWQQSRSRAVCFRLSIIIFPPILNCCTHGTTS